MTTQTHRIDPLDYRKLEVWAAQAILGVVKQTFDGVEASELINSYIVHRDPGPEWAAMSPDRRAILCWRQVHRLINDHELDGYYSDNPNHNRSRLRLRATNPLDRIVLALDES